MILYCKLVFSFPLTYRIVNTRPTYQLRIFPAISMPISIKSQRRFSIFLETTAISPAMINLLTGAGVSIFTVSKPNNKRWIQNGRQSNTVFNAVEVGCYRAGYCSHFVRCKYTGLQVFIVFFCMLLTPPMTQQPHPPDSGPGPPRNRRFTVTLIYTHHTR